MKEAKGERGNLPRELGEFFSRGGRSLILKGAPGTGKTTLAMEILERFKSDGESIFISARIDEQSLKSHLRWVSFGMLLSGGKDDGSRNKRKGRISRKELDRLESRVEDGDESLETDYDPGPGSGTMEGDTLTIDITALLPEIDSLYGKLETGMPARAMVAIDSIDSLAEKYGIAPRRLIHTLQKDLVERSNVNVIFILETADSNSLEYMGDGVISLEMEDAGGRRLRVMNIEKMRGQCIRNPQRAFSLAGGRFDCFARGTDSISARASAPGIRLGELLGGVTEPGKYTLLEFDGPVPVDTVRGLVRSICAVASSDTGIYTTPSLRLLEPGPAPDEHSAAVRVISPAAMVEKDSVDAGMVRVDGESFPADFGRPFIDGLFPERNKRLFLLDANQLLSHYGQAAIGDVEKHIAHLLRGGGTCIAFSWPASNPVDMDLGMSDRLVRVTKRGPDILFHGEKPHTPLYVLASGEEGSELRAIL